MTILLLNLASVDRKAVASGTGGALITVYVPGIFALPAQ